jgi:hypothetical protein
VKTGDKQKIAMMARYPLDLYVKGRHRVIRNRTEFVRDYDHLFTASIGRDILMQAPECLFANWQGAMIANGEVWFEESKNGGMEIKTLNVPEP